MPHPARPAAPAALSKNARIVLEKRYLIKDKTGAPTEQPEDLFWRGRDGCRGGGSAVWRERGRDGRGGG